MLTKLNIDALSAILENRLTTTIVSKKHRTGVLGLLPSLRGHIDGLDQIVIDDVMERIAQTGANTVFVDGSNLGALISSVKCHLPQVEIIAFFHNVEARFFWGALRRRFTPRALAVLTANFLAERQAARAADKIVCLSLRDSELLFRLYGRRATHISPIAVRETPTASDPNDKVPPDSEYALFVGGAFYANRDGIAWFARHVAPYVKLQTVVIGRGIEDMRESLEKSGNVIVVGGVGSLAPWYARARFTIAPIFDGSGMKTKVAEALMYGKRVIGTPEAFSGYELSPKAVGACCSTAEEFIEAFEKLTRCEMPSDDPALRAVYESNYSFEAAKKRMKNILDDSTAPLRG